MSRKTCKVQIGQCIKTIIISLIAFCTAIIPFTLSGELIFTFKTLPIIGDGSIVAYQNGIISYFTTKVGFSNSIIDLIFNYNIYILYGILLANVLFSLLLIILRFNFLRIIFKVLTIIFGFALIVVALSYLVMVVALIYCMFSGYFDLYDVLNSLLNCGIIYYFVTMFFVFAIIGKQFGYYPKRTW